MATTDIDNDTGTQANASENGEDRAARLRRQASEAYGAARERAQSAYASTRQGAADGIDASPIAALVGGFAVGALLAGLLPRTRRETEVLGGVGGRINDMAREAARAARDAGRDKLDEYGLNRDGLGERISELANNASAALKRSSGGGGRGD
jgi:hypothetical protein